MRMRIGILVAGVACAMAVAPRAADGPYQFIKDVEIGGEGGWDYLNSMHLKIYGINGK